MKLKVIKSISRKAEYPTLKIYIERSITHKWKFHYIYIGLIWLNRNYLIIITNE